ncbi:helicase-like protein [Antricoccus suffuscus]|uniref:Helicase-like protein n=1 Tax=Antricoccus suffuscus TaxID=1629062 RepID=A0A2T0ZXW5_9ACTN|nr:DEAD/DEAH box helicase [Antricoccus suffuscus]PRZ41196.1 helicase-like protein [Antricoccus suffuscus]
MALIDHLPENTDPDSLYDAFATSTARAGLELYPAQDEALIEILSGSNVIVATPTGSGKSLIAAGAQFAALAQGKRSVYTAPIKALVSEKFFALCDMFGAENVGMLTGDASVNPDAPIITATAEVLANKALREGPGADIGLVVMDEFHFYSDPDRGWAWQVPLIELPQAQFVLMSATLGDTSRFESELTRRTGRTSTTVTSAERPVPLNFEYVVTPVHETLEELLSTHQAPVYVVHFTQASALERAQALSSLKVCTREEKDAIAAKIGNFRFRSGFGKTLSRLVRMGIGVHHAGMLPRYRRLVETLTQAGLLKVICGTDTLGVGINVPIRTVLFSGLSKYDGVRQRHLHVREFHQIAGRAGRAGYDTVGTVVVQAPEHEVENYKALAKAGDDPKKRRKVVRKKPPQGFVSWSEKTFDYLIGAAPEPLVSRMRVSHSMLLNVIARPGPPPEQQDGRNSAFEAMRHLLRDNDEDRRSQNRLVRESISIYRALLAGGVVEQLNTPDADGRLVRLTVDLQENFALNQPLSPFAVAALELLDVEDPTYALDVVSILESTLEDPRTIISAQRSKARGEAVAEMKADGIEYDERMELLEDIAHPQPLRELLEAAYSRYRSGHPWIADYELQPKTVARDMFERAMTFTEYVSFYQLARSEGMVLRYLSDAYKALRHTVPDTARTEDLSDLTEWLGEVVRQTDSSLLDEWEQLASGDTSVEVRPEMVDDEPRPVTGNKRAFRVLVRNALFRRVELAALRRYDELGALDVEAGWDAEAWEEALTAYFDEYDRIGTGPDARGPAMLTIEEYDDRWELRQIFDDPDSDHDWGISAVVELDASDNAGTAVLQVRDVGPVRQFAD